MHVHRIDGYMLQRLQKCATDRANALGSRVLCALFAIMALCATPLGTGELFAAESHVYERRNGDLREGDLPLRFAMPGGPALAFETVEEPERATLSSVLLDDGPAAVAAPAPLDGGETGVVPAARLQPAIPGRPDAGFQARAPPRA
ncbi:MAG: hypothetical protein KF694_22885 [Mesorhizobium sp.]|nr:hypothetical protein [Mesorhizobium sp.]